MTEYCSSRDSLNFGHSALPVVLKKGRFFGTSRKGRFHVRVCRGCGDTIWYADRIAHVKDDPEADVSLIDGDAPAPADNGPYR